MFNKMSCDVGIRVLLTTKLIDTRFLGTEPQTPRRPEFHPEHPPSSTNAEVGQGGSLPCEVYSDFPPEIHWLKRITSPTPGAFISQPRLPSDEEVESIQPQFVPNGTITIGDVKYQVLTGKQCARNGFQFEISRIQILPSAPASSTNVGYISILLLPKRLQESDAGYYICLAFNSAGYNFRQAYLNVTRGRNLALFNGGICAIRAKVSKMSQLNSITPAQTTTTTRTGTTSIGATRRTGTRP